MKPSWLTGTAFITQADRLLQEWGVELQVYGVTNSQWMLLLNQPIALGTWQSALDKQVWKLTAVLRTPHVFLKVNV